MNCRSENNWNRHAMGSVQEEQEFQNILNSIICYTDLPASEAA